MAARFLLTLCCWLFLLSFGSPASVQAAPFRHVVLDPGHGGHDQGGKIGLIYEKYLAMDVARRTKTYLEGKRIKVTMTRSTDNFVDLGARAAVANGISGAIFVSIHFNWVSYGGPSGTETFYYSQISQPLAASVQQAISAGIGTPNRGVKFARYKVLRDCAVPAALIEGGFISTATERARILDPKYRQRLAELIGEGIIRYGRS